MKINGNTKVIGFLGSTYRTSKMYDVYNSAFQALELNFVYVPFHGQDLKKAVEGIRNLGIAAVGVSIPYKVKIMKYCDDLDISSKRSGTVAVVVNQKGRLIGGTTDGIGAVNALKEQKVDLKGKKVVILGAGGAARDIAFNVSDKGGRVHILNRTIKKAQFLAQAIGSNVDYSGLKDLQIALRKADILINATSYGMANTETEEKSLVKPAWLRKGMVVMDIIGKPRKTKLLKDALKQECKVVYGHRMLLWQAVAKFKMYTGMDAPVTVMEKAMERVKDS